MMQTWLGLRVDVEQSSCAQLMNVGLLIGFSGLIEGFLENLEERPNQLVPSDNDQLIVVQ